MPLYCIKPLPIQLKAEGGRLKAGAYIIEVKTTDVRAMIKILKNTLKPRDFIPFRIRATLTQPTNSNTPSSFPHHNCSPNSWQFPTQCNYILHILYHNTLTVQEHTFNPHSKSIKSPFHTRNHTHLTYWNTYNGQSIPQVHNCILYPTAQSLPYNAIATTHHKT